MKYNSLGWTTGEGTSPENNPAYQAIRAISNEVVFSHNLYQKGYKNRRRQKDKHFEMRFVDNRRRYKWSKTEITSSEETDDIVMSDRAEPRKLCIQEISNGSKYELVTK